jgi:hypothetical protein
MTVRASITLLLLVFAPGLALAAKPLGKALPRRVIKLDVIKVEGRIQKPQAFYILQRSNLGFESLEARQSFVPRILESIEQKPF